jgi:lysophospholipase L1-like esterase
VLAQTGATHVVVLEGINDLGMARQGPRPTVADLIAGHRQLIARGRARGLAVIGATLLPYEGTVFPGYWSAEGEATRQKFNDWLRTSGAYDGIIDFDAVMRDPKAPARMRPEFDSGDHLHPNDAGYQAMANALDLALFRAMPAPVERRALFAPPAWPIGYATQQDAD